MHPATTSSSLLLRVRDPDDAQAWGRLVARYGPLLRGWLRRHAVPPHDQDDLVQDVLHAVAREMPSFTYDPRKGGFRGWLRTILVRRLRHYWRRRRSRPLATGDDGFITGVLDQLEDPRSSLARVWDQEHDRHVVARLLEVVRGDFEATTWEAFRCTALGGQDVSAVAEALGQTANAVKLARHRVLKRLRQEAEGLIE
jgi:RNA polymerase sigma-70 factor (ECF subfamily)